MNSMVILTQFFRFSPLFSGESPLSDYHFQIAAQSTHPQKDTKIVIKVFMVKNMDLNDAGEAITANKKSLPLPHFFRYKHHHLHRTSPLFRLPCLSSKPTTPEWPTSNAITIQSINVDVFSSSFTPNKKKRLRSSCQRKFFRSVLYINRKKWKVICTLVEKMYIEEHMDLQLKTIEKQWTNQNSYCDKDIFCENIDLSNAGNAITDEVGRKRRDKWLDGEGGIRGWMEEEKERDEESNGWF